MEPVQEVEVALAREHRNQTLHGRRPITGQEDVQLGRSCSQHVVKYVDVANVAQRRTDPSEVVSDVAGPHGI